MDVIMPQLGETVAEGVVTKWYKKVGDAVKADEVLFDVETDKVSTEIPAQANGVVAEILVEAGMTVKVGERLAVIAEGAHAAVARAQAPLATAQDPAAAQRISPTAEHEADIAKAPFAPRAAGAQDRLSPVVRKLLAQNSLDPSAILGSGRNGRITRDDVTAYLARQPAAASAQAPTGAPQTPAERIEPTAEISTGTVAPTARVAGQVIPLNSVRKRIAENMQKSWTTVPHVLQVVEADFHRIGEARRETGAAWKEREGFSLTYLPFVVRALSIALGRYPKLNGSFDGEKLILDRRINIGIAVDMNFEGLTVPVLKDVPNKSLPHLAREMNDLAVRARAGKLKPDELTEGTYTVTNNGAFGTVITAPIINAPQVAILSTDGVRKKPVVLEAPEGDSIAIRPIGVLAQSFDHRAVDGAYAAAFLRELKLIIETRHWTQDLQS
jgi:pyruvate dehydrogenase E2 component (dihydrolipoamide acetyltransferase)